MTTYSVNIAAEAIMIRGCQPDPVALEAMAGQLGLSEVSSDISRVQDFENTVAWEVNLYGTAETDPDGIEALAMRAEDLMRGLGYRSPEVFLDTDDAEQSPPAGDLTFFI